MGIDLSNVKWDQFLIYMVVIVVSITVHEFGHAFSADRLGDDTPRRQGRVTLLPTEHFDPLGFMMIVFMALGGRGLGWGKPVQFNPANLSHPRRDQIIITAAGPFTNLCIATITGLIIRFTGDSLAGSLTEQFLFAFLSTNLGLMFFNLIPIPPLDGSRILSNVLPIEQAQAYDRTMGMYGPFILLGLVFLGGPILGLILGPPIATMAEFLTGLRFR